MFRFTIRDLFWLTILVALGCGWWLEHTRANRANADRVALTQKLGDTEADRDMLYGVLTTSGVRFNLHFRTVTRPSTDNHP